MRVLTHIKRLDDAFGQFLVRVICDCGACREIEPEALARLVALGWTTHSISALTQLSVEAIELLAEQAAA